MLAVIAIASLACTPISHGSSTSAVQEFRFAESLYRKAQTEKEKKGPSWQDAADRFQAFIEQHANHTQAPLAHFYLAESLVQTSNYPAAREHYQHFMRKAKRTDALVPNAHFRVGEALFFEGRYKECLAKLEAFRSNHPEHEWDASALWYSSQAAFHIATREKTQANMDQARTMLESALTLQHENRTVRAQFQLGQLDYLSQNYAAALNRFRQAEVGMSHGSDQLLATLWIGKTRLSLGQYNDANHEFEKLKLLAPSHPLAETACFHLARCAQLSKQPDVAKDSFSKYQLHWPDGEFADETLMALIGIEMKSAAWDRAERLWGRFCQQFPHHPRLIPTARMMAKEYLRRNQPARAVKVLRVAMTDGRTAGPVDLYLHALALQSAGDSQQAMVRLREIYEQHPQSHVWGDATIRLAHAHLQLEETAQGKALLRALLASRSSNHNDVVTQSRYLLGTLAAEDGQWADVVDFMSYLVEKNHPYSDAARYWIAEAYYRLGDLDQAEAQLALLEPKTDELDATWVGMVPLRQAQILARREQWNEATTVAATIGLRFPDFQQQHEVDLLLGRCHAAKGQFTAAREAYQRVIASPTGANSETAAIAQWMIGESYFHQKRFQNALEAYREGELNYPFDRWKAACLIQAGKCYEATGRRESAIKAYSRLLRDLADSPFHAEASQRLQALQPRLDESNRDASTLATDN